MTYPTGATAGLALIMLAGCATVVTETTRSEPRPRPARPPSAAVKLLEEDVPDRPHKVIGSVRARVKLSPGGRLEAPPARILAELERQARSLGGEALLPIMVTPHAGRGSYVLPTGHASLGGSEVWTALVIVWLEEPGSGGRPGTHRE